MLMNHYYAQNYASVMWTTLLTTASVGHIYCRHIARFHYVCLSHKSGRSERPLYGNFIINETDLAESKNKQMHIQLFRERLSRKSVKGNGTMSKTLLWVTAALQLLDSSSRYFSHREGNNTNMCSHAFSFLLFYPHEPQPSSAKQS